MLLTILVFSWNPSLSFPTTPTYFFGPAVVGLTEKMIFRKLKISQSCYKLSRARAARTSLIFYLELWAQLPRIKIKGGTRRSGSAQCRADSVYSRCAKLWTFQIKTLKPLQWGWNNALKLASQNAPSYFVQSHWPILTTMILNVIW